MPPLLSSVCLSLLGILLLILSAASLLATTSLEVIGLAIGLGSLAAGIGLLWRKRWGFFMAFGVFSAQCAIHLVAHLEGFGKARMPGINEPFDVLTNVAGDYFSKWDISRQLTAAGVYWLLILVLAGSRGAMNLELGSAIAQGISPRIQRRLLLGLAVLSTLLLVTALAIGGLTAVIAVAELDRPSAPGDMGNAGLLVIFPIAIVVVGLAILGGTGLAASLLFLSRLRQNNSQV